MSSADIVQTVGSMSILVLFAELINKAFRIFDIDF